MAISIVAWPSIDPRAATAAAAAVGGRELCTSVKMAVGNRDISDFIYVAIIHVASRRQPPAPHRWAAARNCQ